MANEFYITAGLPAIDYNDALPAGDNQFFITAGLTANDYTPPAGGAIKTDRTRPIGIFRGMFKQMWGDVA